MKQFFRDWWPLILICTGFICFVAFILYDIKKVNAKRDLEKQYCGPVIDKGYDPPSSGYKTHLDEQYWVVIRDEDCHKAVRVHVTPACYYSNEKGERACFNLSGEDMQYYGNTTDFRHLK